jgi:hypothetical protein
MSSLRRKIVFARSFAMYICGAAMETTTEGVGIA